MLVHEVRFCCLWRRDFSFFFSYSFVSSFAESKIDKWVRYDAEGLLKYNQHYLSRVYPKGIRVDSSNLAPMRENSAVDAFRFCLFTPLFFSSAAWHAGCQIVAMNYQTNDKPMWIYDARFADNGNCGFVAQPNRFFKPGFDPLFVAPSAQCTLIVEMISGWQLPKVSGQSEIIDPYVQVSQQHALSRQRALVSCRCQKGRRLWPQR